MQPLSPFYCGHERRTRRELTNKLFLYPGAPEGFYIFRSSGEHKPNFQVVDNDAQSINRKGK